MLPGSFGGTNSHNMKQFSITFPNFPHIRRYIYINGENKLIQQKQMA